MRSCFLRAVMFLAAVVGIILVPALPAQAQCTHLGQQVVCPSGVSDGSTSLFFTNGGIIWQTPTGSTTSSPRAGCCPPFTAPTPTAPSATGLTPTTGAGQLAVSNAVRTPSGAVVSDEALREAGARLAQAESRASMAYENQRQRALQAEQEAATAEEAAEAHRQSVEVHERIAREAAESEPRDREAAEHFYSDARFVESMAREAANRGASDEARNLRGLARSHRSDGERLEHRARNTAEAAVRERAGAEEADRRARVARGRAADERRLAEEARQRVQVARRQLQEGSSEADVAEAERVLTARDWRRLAEKLYSPEVSESPAALMETPPLQIQPAEQAQPAQPVQQAQQFTVYFSDYATGRVYLRGYMEARPVINQSDAANARPPAPRLP